MALKNPRLRYTVTEPGKPSFERKAEVSGYVVSREKLVSLLVHPWAEGAKISNLRAVDEKGDDLPEQPDELKEATVETPAPVPTEVPAGQ